MIRTRLTSLGLVCLLAWANPLSAQTGGPALPGLVQDALVVRDSNQVPHICARTERDAIFLQGFVHAQDRFFQMDTLRRNFSGTLAELVGAAALPQDVQLRTLGLRRAAEASWAAYQQNPDTAQLVVDLQAYSDGVNAFLAQGVAPPEYAALEITAAGIEPWTPLDSVTIGKGLAFGLSFDLGDIDRTILAQTYAGTGAALGFDGTALFSEDLVRSAPFDPTVSIPQANRLASSAARQTIEPARHLPGVLDLARNYRDAIADLPVLGPALRRGEYEGGSNWWIVDGDHTTSGHAMLANDPHLALNTPSTFYETHLIASADPTCGLNLVFGTATLHPAAEGATRPSFEPTSSGASLDAIGISFAGAPGVVLGCNQRICWGATVNPMDVTDVYQEVLQLDPQSGLPVATMFEGQPEPLVLIPQSFRLNVLGDGEMNSSADAGIGPLEGGLTLVVPRRNQGPIVDFDVTSQPVTALSVQYTGWGATYELEAFRLAMYADNLGEFREALQFFDVGSQNFGYADVDGNIAYFTSAEMPIREDLQTGVVAGGIPPFLIRDGTHALPHEWLPAQPVGTQALPYQILPADEMPHLINPANGYIANANNDPIGTTLDNNPLNQLRPGGGLYYLSPGYTSLRIGRIDRLLDAALSQGGKVSVADFEAIQSNHQLLDAELVLPHLLQAWNRASAAGGAPELGAYSADGELREAIQRLTAWDFSTPTGIPEGYDPGDDPTNLPAPTAQEIDQSVAATLFSTWRGQVVRRVIDGTLEPLGLGSALPGSTSAYTALDHLLETFDSSQGVGASGINFFPGPTGQAEDDRDIALLQSLRDALDLLRSDAFDDAFGGSTDQEDYRWGKLHRITFDHPLGGPFDVPPAGGYATPGPDLQGIARSGGYQAVDASSHSARADGDHDFQFGSGPARRFIGVLNPDRIEAQQVIPGGQSGVLGSPHYADQLALWLTNSYHPLRNDPNDIVEDASVVEPYGGSGCSEGPNRLCLNQNRFEASVAWRTAADTGEGRVVPTPSDDSGLLFFFSADNWEMLIKVIDGCAFNDHYWVFSAAATDVEWTLTVTDTASGASKQYRNRLGTPSVAVTDTSAFATCP